MQSVFNDCISGYVFLLVIQVRVRCVIINTINLRVQAVSFVFYNCLNNQFDYQGYYRRGRQLL